MSRSPKKLPILLVDTRERKPWCFDGDDDFGGVVYQKLDAGDYSIQGMEDIIVVERKASLDELYMNFCDKARRQRIYAEFDRLIDHRFKFIVIEEDCCDVTNHRNYYVNKKRINKYSPKMPVAVVMSNLVTLMIEHNAQVIFAGSSAKDITKDILLHAYKLHQKGKLIEGD